MFFNLFPKKKLQPLIITINGAVYYNNTATKEETERITRNVIDAITRPRNECLLSERTNLDEKQSCHKCKALTRHGCFLEGCPVAKVKLNDVEKTLE